MIVSRTPFRISFAGGGTDLRSFYSQEPGQVLSTAIDKYLYVLVRRQLGIVECKYRVNYSRVEFCHTLEDIEHPIVRAALRTYPDDGPLEVTTFADIPAYTGLGSSSAFAVGLLHALAALAGQYLTKSQLAARAATLEVDTLGRQVGKQDHYASAYGGLNVFTFQSDETVTVEPVCCRPAVRQQLQERLLLFYTGLKRDASGVLEAQARCDQRQPLRCLQAQVPHLRDLLTTANNGPAFGQILHAGWLVKRDLGAAVSSPQIDRWYNLALSAGAVGGKLLGAGGGGFLLFYVEPARQAAVTRALTEAGLCRVPFRFDTGGSRITYYDQDIEDREAA